MLYTQIYYHVIISTMKRESVLVDHNLEKFFRFSWDILKEKNCKLYRINAFKNHFHMLVQLNPNCPLSDLISDLKTRSASWIIEQRVFPTFSAWENGYTAITCSVFNKDKIIQYIKNQKEIHKNLSFREELLKILKENKIDYTEKVLD